MQLRGIAFFLVTVLPLSLGAAQGLPGQSQTSEQVAVTPPAQHQVEPPNATASAADLEKRGDELRANKYYLDAVDYYRAALAKKPDDPQILNKLGIAELLLTRYKEARKSFEHAVKHERDYADARNNLGVIYYIEKKYPKAIKEYERAIALRPDAASFYSNLGAAYFSKKDFEKAVAAYSKALQLDPDVFERTSHSGVAAQMAKPEDRAHYDYVLAKLYAQSGATDRSLEYLRKAMEDGYKGIDNVYKDAEFTNLRKDPRFAALMAAKPPGIPD